MTSKYISEETKTVRRLALGVTSIGFGQSAFVVLVPLVMARLGLTTSDLGFAVAAGTLAFLIGAPLWGSASVSHGRMIRVLGLAMLAAQAMLVAQLLAGPTAYGIAMAGLIASRLIYGFAAAGVMPTAQAWLAGAVDTDRRQAAFGLLSAGLNLGRLAGSVAGAAAAIATQLTVALFALAPLLLWLTPTGADKREASAKAISSKLSPFDRRILPFLLIGACMTAGFGQVQIMLGPVLQWKLGLDAGQATAATGFALALVAVAMIAMQALVLPRLRWSERSGILAGTGLVAAGMAGLTIASGYGLGALALVATGFGTALATPAYTAWLARRVDNHEQGAAAGWLSSAHVAGQTAGALIGGFAFQISPALPLAGCAGLAVAAAAIAATLARHGGTRQ